VLKRLLKAEYFVPREQCCEPFDVGAVSGGRKTVRGQQFLQCGSSS
jgi:hypothetical protein